MSDIMVVDNHDSNQVVDNLEENIWYSDDVEVVVTKWRNCADITDSIEKRQKRFELLVELNDSFKSCDLDVMRDVIEALSRQVHGAEYTYDHLRFNQPIQITDIIRVMCPKHGSFNVRLIDHLLAPINHQYAFGCKKCLIELRKGRGGPSRKNVTMFIDSSEIKHTSKFDYRFVKYNDNQSQIKLICLQCNMLRRIPIFITTPNNNLAGKGCKPCGDYRRDNFHLQSMSDVVLRGWPDKYDYIELYKPELPLTGQRITYKCKSCNYLNKKQQLSGHLNRGYGCWKCGRQRIIKSQTMTFEEFVKQARLIHGDKYEYIELSRNKKLNRPRTYIRYLCNTCGFETKHQRSSDHIINGYGCKRCLKMNRRGPCLKLITRPMRIYFVKFTKYDVSNNFAISTACKIGCTTKPAIHHRFSNELDDGIICEVLYQKVFEPGNLAYKLEQDIITQFKEYRYFGDILLKVGGNSEMFTTEAIPYILSYIDKHVTNI